MSNYDHDLHHCNDDQCFICTGGLSKCNKCGGAESSLPTDCPGTLMDEATQQAISRGERDFIDGSWCHDEVTDTDWDKLKKLSTGNHDE